MQPELPTMLPVGATGTASMTGGSTGATGSQAPPQNPANVAQCSQFPEKYRKSCMNLLRELAKRTMEIVTVGEGNVELVATGSAVDKAKNLCDGQAEVLNSRQVTMCDALKREYASKIESLMAGEKDQGFCRIYASSNNMAACQSVMNSLMSGLQTIAAMSTPPLTLKEAAPLEVGKNLCDEMIGYLNAEQKAACKELKSKTMKELELFTKPVNPKEHKAADPCAKVAGDAAKYANCRAVLNGAPVQAPAAPAAAPAATAAAAPAATAAATGGAEAAAAAAPTTAGPASTGKARAFCDEVPEENIEACKKYIIKTRYAIRAIAEKAGLKAEELEAGKTAKRFAIAVCDKVTSESETEECKALKEEMTKSYARLMGGPVGKDFSKSAGAPVPANTTTVVVTAPSAAPPAMDERAKTCVTMALVSEANAKECDVILKGVRKMVANCVNGTGKTFTPAATAVTVLEKSQDICQQMDDSECSAKVSEARAKITTLKAATAEIKAKKAAQVAAAMGITGATGAASATGAAAAAMAAAGVVAPGPAGVVAPAVPAVSPIVAAAAAPAEESTL